MNLSPSFARRALAMTFALLLAACAAPPMDMRAVQAQPSPSALAPGWQHGAFMEIFVRAYQDSDGDGIGDLRGLISRLDYLQDLGVRGIWLMPITASADRDHGYATTDFRAIEPAYGTLADFDELIAQAHRRGIGVITDYVINHSAAAHPLFVAARQDKASPWRDWFVWSHEMPLGWDIWGKNPWYHVGAAPWLHVGEAKDLPKPGADARDFYFGTFGPHMPDFNLRHEQVKQYHFDSLRFWLNRGLDGFRLDAVPHMVENSAKDWNDQPESRKLTRELQALVKSYPRRWVVCEATAEPAVYASADVCGAAFAFGYVRHYVEAARGKEDSVKMVAEYFSKAPHSLSTFVSNHDIFAGRRLWDQLDGDVAKYKLAAAAYLLQPGTPFIYYGEEIGQAGLPDLKGDLPIRGPMSWTGETHTAGFTQGTPFRALAPNRATHNAQSQRGQPDTLHSFYKAMIGLRNQLPSIARGSYEAATAQGLVASWQRKLGAEHTLVAINYGAAPAALALAQLPPGARLVPLYPQAAAVAAVNVYGGAQLELPAQAVQVYAVQAP
jgi:alpha-amylase